MLFHWKHKTETDDIGKADMIHKSNQDWLTLRDRGSLLFLLGERREEPLLATARFSELPPSTARDE